MKAMCVIVIDQQCDENMHLSAYTLLTRGDCNKNRSIVLKIFYSVRSRGSENVESHKERKRTFLTFLF